MSVIGKIPPTILSSCLDLTATLFRIVSPIPIMVPVLNAKHLTTWTEMEIASPAAFQDVKLAKETDTAPNVSPDSISVLT